MVENQENNVVETQNVETTEQNVEVKTKKVEKSTVKSSSLETKQSNKKFDRKKMPTNIKYLVFRYNINVVKIGYKRVLKTLMICDSFIVALLFSVTRFVDNIYIRLLIAFILIFPLFAGIYHLVAMHYKKEDE